MNEGERTRTLSRNLPCYRRYPVTGEGSREARSPQYLLDCVPGSNDSLAKQEPCRTGAVKV